MNSSAWKPITSYDARIERMRQIVQDEEIRQRIESAPQRWELGGTLEQFIEGRVNSLRQDCLPDFYFTLLERAVGYLPYSELRRLVEHGVMPIPPTEAIGVAALNRDWAIVDLVIADRRLEGMVSVESTVAWLRAGYGDALNLKYATDGLLRRRQSASKAMSGV